MAVVTKILLAMLALLQSFLSYLESLYFMPSVLERKSSHLLLAGQRQPPQVFYEKRCS